MSAPIETRTSGQVLAIVQELIDEKEDMRKRFTEHLATAQKERDDARDEVKYWKGYGDIVRNQEVSDLRERCEFIAKRCEGIAKERDFNAAELQTARKERDDALKNRDELKVLDGERIQTLIVERNQALAKVEQERRGRAECDVFPSNRGSASDFEWLRQSNQSLSEHNNMLKKEASYQSAMREKLKSVLDNCVAQNAKLVEERDAVRKASHRHAARLEQWQGAYERKLKELDSARRVNADWEASFNNTVEQLKNVRRMEEDWKRMYHVVCKERGELRAVLDTLEKHKGKL